MRRKRIVDPCLHPHVKLLGPYAGPDIPVLDVRGGNGAKGQPLTAENINAYFLARSVVVISHHLPATNPREESVDLRPDL